MSTAVVMRPRSEAMALVNPRLDVDVLESWLLEQTDPRLRSQQCVQFVLMLDADKGREVITQRTIDKKLSEDERSAAARSVAEDFDRSSRAFVSTYPRTMRVIISGHIRANDNANSHVQTAFLVAPDLMQNGPGAGFDDAFGPPAEASSLPAVVGHLQRILDTTVRLVATTAQQDKDRLVEIWDKMQAHNDRLEKDRFEMRTQMEDLLDRKAARDAEVSERKAMADLQYRLFSSLMTYGLPIAAQIATQKFGLPAAATTEGHPLESLVKTLGPRQILQIADLLTPEQQGSFKLMAARLVEQWPPDKQAELMQCIAEANEKNEKKAEPPPETPAGEPS